MGLPTQIWTNYQYVQLVQPSSADHIYNIDNKFRSKSEWLYRPYKIMAKAAKIPFSQFGILLMKILKTEKSQNFM